MKRELLVSALLAALLATGASAQTDARPRLRPWTGVIGDEKRQELADFATRINMAPETAMRRLSAVQSLECRGLRITALVVAAPDIVVSAAHAFFERSGIRKSTTSCGIVVHREGFTKLHPIKINSIVTGKFRYGPIETNSPEDWAVLRLQQPILGVEPLALPPDNERFVRDDQPVVLATGPQNNFPLTAGWTRIVEDCAIRRVIDRGAGPSLIKTDCDTGIGASGGAYLASLASGKPVLIGLQSANRGESGCEAYDEALCFALGVPVAGALRDAILKKLEETQTTSAER